MSHWSPDLFAETWEFATRYHAGQSYGGREEGTQVPYLNHIASVAVEVIHVLPLAPDVEGDYAVQCALLHDVIEDTEVTYEMLSARFGEPVAAGVLALTKNGALPKDEQMADSLRRIRAQRPEVAMVKMADRIANLYHPPFYWGAGKIEQYRQEALQIHGALHTANAPLARRLWQRIEAYKQFLVRQDAAGT
jgi:(p)ppGpp synthase/HD superfamily hydrolase